jgi:hypothetical protein
MSQALKLLLTFRLKYILKSWLWIEAVVLLPFNVLVIIPAVTLYFTDYSWELNNLCLLIGGTILLVPGVFLAGWTMRLFAKKGKGTAAPWNPPKKFGRGGTLLSCPKSNVNQRAYDVAGRIVAVKFLVHFYSVHSVFGRKHNLLSAIRRKRFGEKIRQRL